MGPILTTCFYDALFQFFWDGDKDRLSTRVYYYWSKKFYPIEDEV